MPHSVPSEELPILERLLAIRNRLSALKRDRSTYLKADDIMPIKEEVTQEINNLTEVRGGIMVHEKQALNRTDDVMDEVCQMLSLCFLCLGKTRESPAVYSQVVAIKHSFDRLEEFGIYAEEFLEPYTKKLKEIENILKVDERNGALPKAVMQMLKYKFTQCERIRDQLMATIHEVSPELIPIRNKMLRIRRQLISIACQSNFKASDIVPIQEEIRDIDNRREDGKFLAADGSIPAGQAVLVGLLEQIYAYSHDMIIAASTDFSPALQEIRVRLVEIKSQLERLELTHKWTLRQTDLFTYQHQLHDIVMMRHPVDSDRPDKLDKFLDERGEAPEGQTVLNFLLHKCYRIIVILLNESVPVSEALTPIYNQLTSVRQCLLAVKKTGAPCSAEELYPYQMKLMSIENLRKDGKFYDEQGCIPEGQALCVSTLEECYSLLEQLRDDSE
ncbi:uncharacterized protein BYT42DRAFT_599321 [Radiomyces spectabilis]|uniref:uncharacterized protein n=1 Tax=Radiomyces spectabilis TaxID=64574 RepID=UPI0022211AF6|nr:uncharacterized protein BYT42DRAFT_599321 [Radiomyces spectabilis]KAI8374242.1 hypothetical protein BYT42DRAFT_599321 [Radiomyces spectabilis]